MCQLQSIYLIKINLFVYPSHMIYLNNKTKLDNLFSSLLLVVHIQFFFFFTFYYTISTLTHHISIAYVPNKCVNMRPGIILFSLKLVKCVPWWVRFTRFLCNGIDTYRCMEEFFFFENLHHRSVYTVQSVMIKCHWKLKHKTD